MRPLLFRFSFFLASPLTTLAGAGALASALVACGPETKTALTYTQDAKKSYEAALEEYDAHNYIEAQNLFREVKRKYGYSRYARLAELKTADCDLELEKYAEAVRAYKQFIHDHPSDEEDITYARSRIADAQYKQIGDSLVLPAGEERDQATVLEAYNEMQSFVRDYPAAKEADRIRKLLAEVTGKLIRHELSVARFYLTRDNYEAAVLRIEYALRKFGTRHVLEPLEEKKNGITVTRSKDREVVGANSPASELESEALVLLGETYLRLKKGDKAHEAFQAVVDIYPESPYVVQAKRYLDYGSANGGFVTAPSASPPSANAPGNVPASVSPATTTAPPSTIRLN